MPDGDSDNFPCHVYGIITGCDGKTLGSRVGRGEKFCKAQKSLVKKKVQRN